MNEKEVSEIRRRFRPDQNSISALHGCLVNENREIVSEFEQSLLTSPQEETENILTVLRRTLSGGLGKNLIDIEFETQQVVHSEEHGLLMALRQSGLKDAEAVHTFYQKAVQSLKIEGNYLILLIHDRYDVPFRAGDGQRIEDSDAVYSYILCSICPVKLSKPALSYYMTEQQFHNCPIDWLVAAPELGFLFPAFDDRSANLYSALYYSRNTADTHAEFVDAIFRRPLPLPAQTQKEAFQGLLERVLEEDCRYDVVESLHGRLCDMIEEHRENREEEPLLVNDRAVKGLLSACGVADSRLEHFEEEYREAFGPQAALPPANITDRKKLEVKTPEVTIQIRSDRRDLIETRVIDGAKYILVRTEEDVTVNGVRVHID